MERTYSVSFAYPSSLTNIGECNGNQEFSDEVISADCLSARFTGFMADYNRNASDAIVAHFNVFYSAIRQFDSAEFILMVKMWKVLLKEFHLFVQGLEQLLDETPSEDMLTDIRSKLYMSIFLLTNFANLFEDRELRKAGSQADNGGKMVRGGRRRGGKKVVIGQLGFDWIHEKKRLLTSYCDILSPQLGKIFQSSSSKENMTKAIASLAIRFLNSWCSSFQEPLFKLLVLFLENNSDYAPILAKECAHSLSESTADPSVFVSLVESVSRVDAGRSFVTLLFIEISKVDSSELASEGAGVKNYGTFLTQLAADLPDVVIHGLSSLCNLRAKQSPTLRGGILSVFCELLLAKLHGEELEPRSRNLRDQLLAAMMTHVHDHNAIVRSKVLQLWKKLCLGNCIPVTTFRSLAPLVSGRIKDTSILVRRSALQLLTALVENNPFLMKLSVEYISQQIHDVKADLERLRLLNESTDADGISRREEAEFWDRARNAAEEAVRSVYNKFWKEGAFVPTEDLSMAIASADNLNQDICNAFELITVDNFQEAVTAMIAISMKYANNCYFSLMLNSDLTLEEFMAQVMPLLRKFYIGLRIAGNVIYPSLTEESTANMINCPADVELNRKQIARNYLEDCRCFSAVLLQSIAMVMEMLCDNQQLDALEAVLFMVACAEKKIISRVGNCWLCWNLIWSNQKGVKTAVLSAFRRLYFQNGDNDCRDEEAVKRLIELTLSADHEKLITLEKVLQESFNDDSLQKEVIRACWKFFYAAISEEERSALITLLGMMLRIDPPIFIEHLTDVITYALGAKAFSNPYLALRACEAIKKLGDVDRVDKKAKKYLHSFNEQFQASVCERLSMCQEQVVKCQLVPRVTLLLSESICDDSHPLWVPIMRQVVELIFNIAERPDVLAAKLLRSVAEAAFNATESSRNVSFGRLLQLVGEVAIRTVNFAHTTLIGLVQTHQQHYGAHSDDQRSRSDWATEATPAEYAKMNVEHFVEVEALNSFSLLRPFADIVIKVCKNIDLYPDRLTQCAAGTALLKLMHISSKFCANNCKLLFNLLENSPHADLRMTIVQLLPDLCVRYPNELDSWTEKLFARLFDDNIQVRIACVSSVSHLILQDRIKPRIFIADIAICCMDDNAEVANMAKAFFKQYSTKEPLYNALALIVQRLSEDGSTMDFEKFKSLMMWLFGLVHKDSQLEKVVERFCQLFTGIQPLKYMENLSCSLTLLKYSDKMLKLKSWKDELDKWHEFYASATATQQKTIIQQTDNGTTTADVPLSTPAPAAEEATLDNEEEHSSSDEHVNEDVNESRRVTRSMLRSRRTECDDEEVNASRGSTPSSGNDEQVEQESDRSPMIRRSMVESSRAEVEPKRRGRRPTT